MASSTSNPTIEPPMSASAAAPAVEAAVKAASPNMDKLKQTAGNARKAVEDVAGVFKNAVMGSGDKAKGAVGGLLGFVKNVADKAFGIVTGTANIAFKTASTFKKTTAVALVVGAAIAVKKWMNNRDKSKELEAARNANELMETKLTNDAVQTQMQSGKPTFDNEVAGNAAAKVTAARAAQTQMANAR